MPGDDMEGDGIDMGIGRWIALHAAVARRFVADRRAHICFHEAAGNVRPAQSRRTNIHPGADVSVAREDVLQCFRRSGGGKRPSGDFMKDYRAFGA